MIAALLLAAYVWLTLAGCALSALLPGFLLVLLIVARWARSLPP